jgi:hypothetical protein
MSSAMQPVRIFSSTEGIRRAFLRLAILSALMVFVVLETDVLLTQWISGNTSAKFIVGTAFLLAGISLALFAVVAAVGLAVAAVFDWAVTQRPADDAGHLADHTRNAI